MSVSDATFRQKIPQLSILFNLIHVYNSEYGENVNNFFLVLPIVIILGFLSGSVPFSIVIGKLVYKKDPRNFGSGNAGATNAFRVFGWKAGLLVLIGDIGKGVLATLVISRIGAELTIPFEAVQLIAGCSAVAGHIWSVFAGFRGGKGVGTAAGMLVSLYPLPFLFAFILFCTAVALTGYVSLGSLTAAISFPAIIWIMDASGFRTFSPALRWVSVAIGLLLVFTHRKNVMRLYRGTESRFSKLAILRHREKNRDNNAGG